MTNNPLRLISKLRIAENQFPTIMARELMIVAADAKALITGRIQDTGKNADGDDFGIYTPSTQSIKKKKQHTEEPFPAVNLTDTGAMFRNTMPRIIESSSNKIVVRIAPIQDENINKMEWNQKRFGKILELDKDESNLIKKSVKKRLDKTLTKLLK